jgi:acyl-CoA thioesterase-1
MKYFWIVLLVLGGVYLNRSYAYFYDYLRMYPLRAPGQQVSPVQQTEVGKAKFVTLGDSLMVGVGTDSYEQSLGYLLYKQANTKNDLDLINLGIPGTEAKDILKVEGPAAIKENPKIVVVFIGVNDVHNFVPVTTFQSNYSKFIKDLTTQTSAQITLINIPYLGSNLVLLPPWNTFMDLRTQQFNHIIHQIAKQNNLKVVDLYSFSRQNFVKSSPLYSQDQFHPSAAGYQKWADYINAN